MKRAITLIAGAAVIASATATQTKKGQYSSFDNDGCTDSDSMNFGIDEGKQFDNFGAQACDQSNTLKSNDNYLGFNAKSADNVGKTSSIANDCDCDKAIFSAPATQNNNVANTNVVASVVANAITVPQVSNANNACETVAAPIQTVAAPIEIVQAPIVRAPIVQAPIVQAAPVTTVASTNNNVATADNKTKQAVVQTCADNQVAVATKNAVAKTNLKKKSSLNEQLQQTLNRNFSDDENHDKTNDVEKANCATSAAAQSGEHSGTIELVKDAVKEGGMEYIERNANCGGFKDGEIDTEDIEVKEHVKAIKHKKCGEKVDKKKWLHRCHHKKAFHEKHGNLKKERCVKGSGKDCNKYDLKRCQGQKNEAHKGKECKDMVKVSKSAHCDDVDKQCYNNAATNVACADQSVDANNENAQNGQVSICKDAQVAQNIKADQSVNNVNYVNNANNANTGSDSC